MQSEVLTQLSGLLAAVTSSCPQPRRCQEEESARGKTKGQREKRCQMPHKPLLCGTPATQRWAGGLAFSSWDRVCAQNEQCPAPAERGRGSGGGQGGRHLRRITTAVSVGAASLFCSPSADHKGATFRETQSHSGKFRGHLAGCNDAGRTLAAPHPPTERL